MQNNTLEYRKTRKWQMHSKTGEWEKAGVGYKIIQEKSEALSICKNIQFSRMKCKWNAPIKRNWVSKQTDDFRRHFTFSFCIHWSGNYRSISILFYSWVIIVPSLKFFDLPMWLQDWNEWKKKKKKKKETRIPELAIENWRNKGNAKGLKTHK